MFYALQFERNFKRLYYEDSVSGGIARQLLWPPQKVYSFEKNHSPDGYSRRISTVLPPRISMRRFASYYSTFLFFFFYIVTKFFQFNFLKLFFVIVFFFILYLLISSIFHPVSICEEENDFTRSR